MATLFLSVSPSKWKHAVIFNGSFFLGRQKESTPSFSNDCSLFLKWSSGNDRVLAFWRRRFEIELSWVFPSFWGINFYSADYLSAAQVRGIFQEHIVQHGSDGLRQHNASRPHDSGS